MIYCCALVLIMFFDYILTNRHVHIEQREKILSVLGVLFLSIPAGLRSSTVGLDTQGYADFFYMVRDMSFKDIQEYYGGRYIFPIRGKMEIGFLALNKLIGYFTDNFQIVLFIISIIVLSGFAYFFYFYKCRVLESCFWLMASSLYFSSFNVMRQYISLVLAINIVCMLKQKKYLKGVLLGGFSISFHQSAVFFIMALVIYKWCHTYRRLKAAVLTGLICLLGYHVIIKWILPLLYEYDFRYLHLLIAEEGSGAGGIALIWILESFLLFRLFLRRKKMIYEGDVLFWSFALILFFMGIENKYFDRIAIFFLPFLIKEIIQRFYSKSPWEYLSKIGLYILLFCMMIKSAFVGQFAFRFWFL